MVSNDFLDQKGLMDPTAGLGSMIPGALSCLWGSAGFRHTKAAAWLLFKSRSAASPGW